MEHYLRQNGHPAERETDEELAHARRRLVRWHQRYGPGFERSRRAGPIMAGLADLRKAIVDRYTGPASGPRKTRSRGTKPNLAHHVGNQGYDSVEEA